MIRKLLLFFFLTVHQVITAQHVPLRIMSQTSVPGTEDARCLMLDHYGLMWVGTDQGFHSFDGYHFKSHRNNAYSPGILPNNYVRCMTEDKKDGLWIGTRDGLARYDRKHGRFKTYHLHGDQARSVNVLFTSADGTVWVGTDAGFSHYDAAKNDFVNVSMPVGVHSFAEDAKGNLYIGTWEGGLFRLDKKSGKMVSYPRLSERNTASSLLIDSRGRLWIGTWENGIVCLDHPENEHAPGIHHVNEGRRDFRTFHQLLEDPVSHSVWGCCIEGLTRVGLDDPAEVENYAELNFCYDMLTDGKGNLWTITRNQGIVHLSTKPSPFRFCYLNPAGRELPVNRIQSVFTSDGRWFWLGLQPYGLARYDRVGNQVTYNSLIPGFSGMTDNFGIHAQTIYAVLDKGDGELWFGSSRGIISWKEGQQARILDDDNTPFLREGSVKDFLRQPDGTIWIAQIDGMAVAFPDGKGWQLKMSEAGRDFSNCDVQSIREDHLHRLWIATDNAGILRVSGDVHQPQSLRFHQYAPINKNYPLDDALACYEDAEHRLWAIASSGGLFLYNPEKDAFEPVNHRFHINVNSIYSIDGDSKGWLWLSTDKGLLRLKGGKNNTVTYYGVEDGLETPHFSPHGSFRHGKELFYGNVSGFFSFEPCQIERYQQVGSAPLIVSDLTIDDVTYDWLDSTFQKKISTCQPFYTKEITIPASVDKFSVGFSLLTYQSQQQCRYAYCLENYDSEWHYTDAENRKATYQNLPAGTYHLRLRAIDSYGHQTEMPYGIRVNVLPPWYLTWWAYLIYAARLAAAVYGGIRWYKNYLKTKNRLAMAVVFTNITHELLTPLTIISASVDELRQKAPQFSANYGLVQNNIQRLTRLLRQILEVRKSQAGQLKLLVARGDLSHFVAYECESIRPMAGAKNGELIVDCPAEGIDAWFDKDKIDKILYNLLSNAVKYNKEGGRITVTLTADRQHATLKVSDEGIGISKDKMKHLYTRFLDGDYRRMNTHGTGIGLSLTRTLVVLHHGKIDCQSREGEGTTFTVTLPITKAAYGEEEIDLTADNKAIDSQQTDQMEEQLMIEADNELENEGNKGEKDYSMLIVEDNYELLELMRKLFAQHYHVYTARNGKMALNTIYKRDLDIVITDVMMPVMDGIELTRWIKDSDDYAQLPVVMLTAKTTDEDKNVGYETGADAYITKPFRMGDLQLRIDSIIRNRERIRRKFSSQTDFKVEEQHYSSPDEIFIKNAIECVKQHLDDADFDREQFASDMCVSSSTLYNKLRALTGQSVTGFINSIRLKEACRIMRQQPNIKMTELSMEVGFNTPKYFTKLFKKEFGMLPSEYINESRG